MADDYIVGPGSTYEHFLAVLLLGKDIYGNPLTVEDFETGTKKLWQLYKETQEEAVTIRWNPFTGRIERHASGIRITIFELVRMIVWLEIARIYPNGDVKSKKKDCTMSETCKKDEDPEQTAMWCLIEEMQTLWNLLGFTPTIHHLIPRSKRILMPPYESTVYAHVVSVVTIEEWYDVFLDFDSPEHSLPGEVQIVKDLNGEEDTGETEKPTDEWVKVCIKAFPDLEARKIREKVGAS